MAARINGKEVGSLFPYDECYQLVLWLTVYNSKNWPGLSLKVTRSGCHRSGTNSGGLQSVK